MDDTGVWCFLFLISSWFYCTFSVNPACDCVRYESNINKAARPFTSPDFPVPYRPNIDCILFTFVGDADEIVEINFLQFDLKPSINGSCRSGDFVRIYGSLPRDEINEWDSYDYELCGRYDDLPQQTFFSANRALTFEFHTASNQIYKGNHTGFMGNFRFLDKKDYLMQPNAKLQFGTQCTWTIQSWALNQFSGRKLFSPRYPQNYPKNSNCQYYLNGQEGELLIIQFENIRLYKTEQSCGAQNTDYITVHDGIDNNAPVIATYCNLHNSEIILSSGPNLYLTFVSDNWHQSRGFAASYSFYPKDKPPPVFVNMTSVTKSESNNVDQENCNLVIKSFQSTSGVIESPESYPNWNIARDCTYTFEGHGKERVQIIFEEFDLRYPPELGDPEDPVESAGCKGTDNLSTYVLVDGYAKLVRAFCGRKMPPSLMSNNVKMTVQFNGGRHPSSEPVKGFRLRYKFVTNFGIEVGTQSSAYVCGFEFLSSDSQKGNFSSPNYPGLYPKDTECHYIFYGRKDEKVIIRFLDFNIEGVSPACSQDDESDYVEFSNFVWPLEDRKMDRYCSDRKHPPPYSMSDTSYFRITFKSNSVYDRTGFLAQYEFRHVKTIGNDDDIDGPPKYDTSTSGGYSWISGRLEISLILLLVLKVITL